MHLGSLGEEGRHTRPNDETGGGRGAYDSPEGSQKGYQCKVGGKPVEGRAGWINGGAAGQRDMDGWINGRVRGYLAKGRNPSGSGDHCGSGWCADGRGSEGPRWKQVTERSILGQTGRRLWHTELTLEALTLRRLVTQHPSRYSVRENNVMGQSADVSCLAWVSVHVY